MTGESPEGWTPPVREDDVREALSVVESEAADRGGDYAAGMRLARFLLEQELLGGEKDLRGRKHMQTDPTTSEFRRDARRLRLVRTEDESGVSGTGVVAVGAELPSGAVVFEWLNDSNPDLQTRANGVSFKPAPRGVEDTVEVHGHGGRTSVKMIDPPRSVREGDAVECDGCGGVVPLDEWTVRPDDSGACPLCGRDGLPERVRETQLIEES